MLDNSFIIAVNDASLIASPNITIFYEAWVWDELRRGQTESDIYLSAFPLEDPPNNYFLAPFEPLTQENSELMIQRLFTLSIAVEEIMFLTALRIALQVREMFSSTNIYFVGFDFSIEQGFSRKTNPSASGAGPDRMRHRIESQERIFLSIRSLLAERGVQLDHVGFRPFSDLTPGAFSERMQHDQLSAEVAHQNHVIVTAEMTTNHLGDVERAKKMLRLAVGQGADFVKFQMRDVDTFYSSEVLDGSYPSPFGSTYRDYRQGLEFDDDQFRELGQYAKSLGVTWFASVLDEPSLDRAIKFDLPLIKLPGTISRKREFLSLVSKRYSGDLVLSTGMTSQEYVNWLLTVFGADRRIFLLHANSAYPTPLEDCNISVVAAYAKLAESYPHIIPGYSSHDDGWFGSALAVAAGARMIEKHVKLGANEWLHFDGVALDLEKYEFSKYVRAVRQASIAVGSSTKRVTPSEHHKY